MYAYLWHVCLYVQICVSVWEGGWSCEAVFECAFAYVLLCVCVYVRVRVWDNTCIHVQAHMQKCLIKAYVVLLLSQAGQTEP